MFFTKIRETIAAFTTPQPIPTIEEQTQAYGRRVREASSGEKPIPAPVRFGVYLAVMIPSALVLSHILHQFTEVKAETFGAIGIMIGFIIAWAIQVAHDSVMRNIPFYKLNPLFGSKIEETIAAFKKPTERSS